MTAIMYTATKIFKSTTSWVFLIILLDNQYVHSMPVSDPFNSVAENFYNSFHKVENDRSYIFGYDVEDFQTSNIQFRIEKRNANGTITGSYGYVEEDGNIHIVHYSADDNGYRAIVEDSLRSPGVMKLFPPEDDENLLKPGMSKVMLTAIQSLENYKRNQVDDQRLRPYDQ